MAVQNLLKPQVDQPVWEWCRFAPFTSNALSAFCTDDTGNNRFIYAMAAAQVFWRYDTVSDSWQELGAPQIAGTVTHALKFDAFGGAIGEVISATSTTLTVGGIASGSLNGLTVKIVGGTGAGQSRTITGAVTTDHVVSIPSAASTSSVTDSTKKYKINQWRNYGLRVSAGQGSGQLRRILLNDITNVVIYDNNYLPLTWTTPFVTTPAVQSSQAVIESVALTVNSAWTITPDSSSRFQVVGGGIWLVNSAGSSSFVYIQFYDILTDTWYQKSSIGSSISGSYGTDFMVEKPTEAATPWVVDAVATSGTARTLVNSIASMTIDQYTNFAIKITGGTGIGQCKRIAANSATTFYLAANWDVNPDATSVYSVIGDVDKIWMVGGATGYFYQYSLESDMWATGAMVNWGIARNATVSLAGTGVSRQPPVGVNSIVRVTNGVLTVAVNAGGTGYTIGDVVTLSTTGTLATAIVTNVDITTGAVTALEQMAKGSGYVAGSSATTGGTGTGLTITITVGATGLVTTSLSHNFVTGDSVTLAGFATDTTFNATFTITVASSTILFINCPASAASPTIPLVNSATLIVDVTKNWGVNELVGKLLHGNAAGTVTATPSITRRILSNTANTITVATGGAALGNGSGRYIISEPNSFGQITSSPLIYEYGDGWVTSASATTLTDSTKVWKRNQWLNFRVRIISGTGLGNEAAITSHTANTLTVASWPNGTPDTTSKYEIMEAYGNVTQVSAASLLIDAAKNWAVNALAGKRLKFTEGLGFFGTDYSITSNTATTITTSGGQATDTTSMYSISDVPLKSSGQVFYWLSGTANAADRGRKFIAFRGGASSIYDVFDITTNRWTLSPPLIPNFITTFTTGTMSAYDNEDALYITKDQSGRVYKYNYADKTLVACSTTPFAHGTAVQGNRMALIRTVDGLKYLYIMRHGGQEMWRTLVFW